MRWKGHHMPLRQRERERYMVDGTKEQRAWRALGHVFKCCSPSRKWFNKWKVHLFWFVVSTFNEDGHNRRNECGSSFFSSLSPLWHVLSRQWVKSPAVEFVPCLRRLASYVLKRPVSHNGHQWEMLHYYTTLRNRSDVL